MATDTSMQLGMVGLGRMGSNLARRLIRDGHRCVVYDVNPDAVKKLVESVVGFQERSRAIIEEMRKMATRNSSEIREAVEDGKRRMARLAAETATLTA